MFKTLIAAATAALMTTAAFAESHAHGDHHVALADVEWVDAPIPGVQLALAWGDDATGTACLFKMDPGVALPMHPATIPWSKAASRMPTAATAISPASACSPSRVPATSRWLNKHQSARHGPGRLAKMPGRRGVVDCRGPFLGPL